MTYKEKVNMTYKEKVKYYAEYYKELITVMPAHYVRPLIAAEAIETEKDKDSVAFSTRQPLFLGHTCKNHLTEYRTAFIKDVMEVVNGRKSTNDLRCD